MSIEPVIVIGVLIAVAMLVTINIVVLFRLAGSNRQRHPGGAAPLERISNRLDMLEEISGNLDSLSQLFLVPHARGGLGETLLSELLHTWLPKPAYDLQYRFTSGTRVDAVVRMGQFMVSIDAKFPLEQVRPLLESEETAMSPAVRRAFVKHIDDIAAKYIRPAEGTLEFALMYIPSEALYYRAFVDSDGTLMGEAVAKGVVPVSPGSLFLYLQTVAFGLRGLKLTGGERKTLELVHQIEQDFRELAKSVDITVSHIRNAQKNGDELAHLTRRFASILRRLSKPTEPTSS